MVAVLVFCPIIITNIQLQSNSEMFCEIAMMQLSNGKYEKAATAFSKVIDLDDSNYLAYYYRAKCYEQIFITSNNSSEEEKQILSVIDDYTSIIEELRPQMKKVIMTNEDIKRYSQLIYGASELSEREVADLYLTLHSLQVQLPDVRLSPHSNEDLTSIYCAALYKRANIFCLFYLYEDAILDYTELISCYPNALTYYFRGTAKLKAMDYYGAIEDFDIAMEIDSSIGSIYANRALAKAGLIDYTYALATAGLLDYTSAKEDISKAIILQPSEDYFLFISGYILFLSGDYDNAVVELNTAIEINPTDDKYFGLRGKVKAHLSEFADAKNDLDIAINLNTSIADYYYDRGMMNFQLGDKNGCILDFEKAINLGYYISDETRAMVGME